MKRTVRWPPQVRDGGLAMTADPNSSAATDRGEALRQLIRLNVLPGTSSNPFAGDLGVDDATFQPDSLGRQAKLKADILARFRTLERSRRARLVDLTLSKGTDGPYRALRVQITYEDLELGRREEMEALIHE